MRCWIWNPKSSSTKGTSDLQHLAQQSQNKKHKYFYLFLTNCLLLCSSNRKRAESSVYREDTENVKEPILLSKVWPSRELIISVFKDFSLETGVWENSCTNNTSSPDCFLSLHLNLYNNSLYSWSRRYVINTPLISPWVSWTGTWRTKSVQTTTWGFMQVAYPWGNFLTGWGHQRRLRYWVNLPTVLNTHQGTFCW